MTLSSIESRWWELHREIAMARARGANPQHLDAMRADLDEIYRSWCEAYVASVKPRRAAGAIDAPADSTGAVSDENTQ